MPLPRTQESRRTQRDGCIAREMRKPNRATRTAAGVLLLFWGLRLLVCHTIPIADPASTGRVGMATSTREDHA